MNRPNLADPGPKLEWTARFAFERRGKTNGACFHSQGKYTSGG